MCEKVWFVKINRSVGIDKIRKIKNICNLQYFEETSHYAIYDIYIYIYINLDFVLAEMIKMFNENRIKVYEKEKEIFYIDIY